MAMRLTIIGAGPGGYETAVRAAGLGIEVTIISDGPLGGTCLNEGCIPTKSFCRNAQFVEDLSKADAFGVEDLNYSFDFGKVLKRKNEVVEQLRNGVEFLMKGKNITLLRGKASLKDSKTVTVDGKDIASDYIIIATGSVPAFLPVPGSDSEGVLTSSDILNLESVPKRLCVIGAGVIGLEFASIFRSFSSEVSVVEYCKDILPRFDVDLAKRLKQALVKRGIAIDTSAQVQSIVKNKDGSLSVNYLKNEKECSVEADKVLMAVGRRANMSSLNLAECGIECSKRGVVVNENMQTSIPNIYAVGDVTGGIMLAHVATFQGERALNHILAVSSGKDADSPVDKIDFSIVPAAVFTNPELAVVGKTEEECKAEGLAFKCMKSFFRANGKAVSMAEPDGFVKIIVSEGDEQHKKGQILGCHLFGAHASDIIQEVAAMMNGKATSEDLASVIHAHPTLGEVILSAVRS